MEDRILEARGVTASEESFRIGGVSFAAQLARQGQIDIEQPILAAIVTRRPPVAATLVVYSALIKAGFSDY